MSRWKILLCKTILLLEWVPAYRRLYRWDNLDDFPDKSKRTVQWRFFWNRSCWGFNILDKLHLLWPYIDHYNPITEFEDVEEPDWEVDGTDG